jgi:peptidoglycan hydrolase CwlO-like protein
MDSNEFKLSTHSLKNNFNNLHYLMEDMDKVYDTQEELFKYYEAEIANRKSELADLNAQNERLKEEHKPKKEVCVNTRLKEEQKHEKEGCVKG